RRGLDERLQYVFEIGTRLADDLEDFAGRGLVFERLLQITRAVAQLVEEPRILHGDHRLRGEILQQRDLLVAKWPDFLPTRRYVAEQVVVPAQRHHQQGTHATQLDSRPRHRI